MSSRSSQPILSGRFSPLRYPGGKGKLARFVADLTRTNRLADGLYVEPYAGGAAVAWELLLTGVVRRIAINDVSRPIYAFWHSVLYQSGELKELIRSTPVDVANRDRLKEMFMNRDELNNIQLAFATFFLNRTNRSGILNGGLIGGRAQTGPWKIDARYNKDELIDRIERIARFSRRVTLTRMDAVKFLRTSSDSWGPKTLVYLDPPYFDKGPDLYLNFYKPGDHAGIAEAVRQLAVPWIVSYDDVKPIHELYVGSPWLQYTIGYSARARFRGREAMFTSPGLNLPPITGSMIELDRWEDRAGQAYSAPGIPIAA